jgi:endonuclease-3
MTDKPIPLLQKNRIEKLFDILAEHIVPESELQWNCPLNLVIAVVLSAQCTDKNVNRATSGFFEDYQTPEAYLKLGEARLREKIKSIGLYKAKAKNIIGLCRMIKDDFHGEVPNTREDLQKLPGVGRKTANVVLNVLYDQPTMAVDTHIFRLANRIGLTRTKTPEATELALLKRIPEKHLKEAHHYLILHGRYVCKARNPDCGNCLIRQYCNYPDKID